MPVQPCGLGDMQVTSADVQVNSSFGTVLQHMGTCPSWQGECVFHLIVLLCSTGLQNTLDSKSTFSVMLIRKS
eukprot:4368933-Amphidinium_carterae.1